MTNEQAKGIKNSPEGGAFILHLNECIDELDTVKVSTLPDDTDIKAEVVGRQRAVEILKRILEPFELEDMDDETGRIEMLKKHGL